MRSSIPALFSAIAAVAAAAHSPFIVDPLSTHQPNGNPDGETNFYNINFNVSSANGDNTVANCHASWGDNSWLQLQAYSVNVPTGSWITCDGNTKKNSFAFQLFPYFSIGNFSLAIQQNVTDASGVTTVYTGETHVTNTTSQYTCQILADESAPYTSGQHARGDCSIPSNASAISVNVAAASRANICSSSINATFVASYDTKWGQDILLVGSIPELGSWKLNEALSMVGTNPNPSPAWAVFTTSVLIPAGTDFEFKYIFRNNSGAETWESGSNRKGSTSKYSCASVIIGGDPDDVRV